jgi:hypothetical protein
VLTYQVKLHRDADKALSTLPAHIRNAARECIAHILPHSPLTRVPGKTKQLKGRLAGIMQYDLPSGYGCDRAIPKTYVIKTRCSA